MRSVAKGTFHILRESVEDFLEDGCPTMAASLSYYTVFSLPPLLILVLLAVGAVMDPGDVRGALEEQIRMVLGPVGTDEVRTIIENAQRPDAGRPLASVLGIAALVFGATGAFAQLQAALNRAWEVEPDPAQGGIRNFVRKRLLSFGMILAIGFLLLVSLVLSAALSTVGGLVTGRMGGYSSTFLQLLNSVVSFLVITLLFAAIYKILPDARIAWRDTWVGAAVTTLLFVLGKYLLGLYLGRSSPGDAYGAAGSLAVLLVWIYYSAMILLFGAELTQRWAEDHGTAIVPEKGAVRVVEEKRRVRT